MVAAWDTSDATVGESDRLQKLHRQIIAASLAAIPDDSCLGAIPRHFSDDVHAPAPLDALATSRRAAMVSRPAQTIFVEADTLADWLNVCSHITIRRNPISANRLLRFTERDGINRRLAYCRWFSSLSLVWAFQGLIE